MRNCVFHLYGASFVTQAQGSKNLFFFRNCKCTINATPLELLYYGAFTKKDELANLRAASNKTDKNDDGLCKTTSQVT